jgi:hypothetical protein
MEAEGFFETSISSYKAAWCHIPEDCNLYDNEPSDSITERVFGPDIEL